MTTACPVVDISPNILRVESETPFGLSLYTHIIGSVTVCSAFAIWDVKHWGAHSNPSPALLGLKKVIQHNDPPTGGACNIDFSIFPKTCNIVYRILLNGLKSVQSTIIIYIELKYFFLETA